MMSEVSDAQLAEPSQLDHQGLKTETRFGVPWTLRDIPRGEGSIENDIYSGIHPSVQADYERICQILKKEAEVLYERYKSYFPSDYQSLWEILRVLDPPEFIGFLTLGIRGEFLSIDQLDQVANLLPSGHPARTVLGTDNISRLRV